MNIGNADLTTAVARDCTVMYANPYPQFATDDTQSYLVLCECKDVPWDGGVVITAADVARMVAMVLRNAR